MREIRRLTEEDVDALVSITINAYPGFRPENLAKHRENFLRAMAEDSTIEFYGLFRDGKMLGSMRLHDFRMQLHSVRIAAGGVGMVAVDLLHKKDKVCKELIQFFLDQLREQGVSMALLYPFRPDFYKHMGFGFGSKMHRYSIPPAQIPRRGDKNKVRFLTVANREELRACYNRKLEQTNGLLEKSDFQLGRLFEDPTARVIGSYEGNQLNGYMIFDFKAHSPEGFLWNDLVIREFFWENTEALNQLLSFLHSQADQISRVIFHTQDDNFHCLFFDPRYGLEEIIPPVCQQTNVSGVGIMYRVTDVQKVFSDLAQHRFGGQDCVLRLNITDTFIPQNNGSYTVAFNGGRAAVTENVNPEVELSLEIAEFSSLLVGAVDLNSLMNLGLVQLSDPVWLAPLNKIFRACKPLCITGF